MIEKKDKSDDLSLPSKVTLSWLFKHVPWKFWTAGISFLVATFLAGAKFSNIFNSQEIRSKPKATTTSHQSVEGFIHLSAINLETSHVAVGSTGVVRSEGTILRLSPSLDANGTKILEGMRVEILKIDGEWIKVKVY